MNRILIMGYIPTINGISTSVLNVYRNIDRSRFQYDFLLYSSCKNIMSPDLEEIVSLGSNLYYLDYTKYNLPETSYDELENIMRSIPDLKGVHVHDLCLMAYPLYLADKIGLPIKVIQAHASWNNYPNIPKTDAELEKERELIKGDQFDRLACSDLAGYFDFKNLPFDIIPNGINTKRFTFNPINRSVLRKQLGINNNTHVIGMVANLYQSKNPIFALGVFHEYHKLNPNSIFFVLGEGRLKHEIRKFVINNELSDCVYIFGAQSEIDIFYDAMDFLLHPSISEGLPNSLVEAQSKGLPCLISDVISNMVQLTPLIHTFSLSFDEKAWAIEISRIIETGIKRRSWHKEIKEAGYDSQDVANTIMALYSKRIQSQQN